MLNNPLVSVIVPVYNVGPYLEECLISIISQTYRNLEILIVDDGSNDGSEILCDEFRQRDDRIQVFHHQINQGVSVARNIALDHMTGDFVVFCDSDDYYFPNYVQRMVEKILESNSDIVICGYQVCYFNDKKHLYDTTVHYDTEQAMSRSEALCALTIDKIAIAVWNKIYKSQLWEKLRFPEGRLFEDTYGTYSVLNSAESILLIPDIMMMHRRERPGSITTTYSIKHIQDWIDTCDQYEDFLSSVIPDLVSRKELELVQTYNLMQMIVKWVRASGERNEMNRLRQEIIQRGKKYNKTLWKTSNHIAFWLFRYFPHMIPIIYSCVLYFYKSVNSISKNK